MVRHRLLAAGVAVVALGSSAACGNDSPTSAPPPQTVTVTESPSSTDTTAPTTSSSSSGEQEAPESLRNTTRTTRCAPSSLSGVIESGDAAAGNRYAKLAVTNTGSKACTLYGYGGLQLTNAAGAANPTKLTRKPDPGPALVTLQPGEKAYKNLHWGAVPDGTEPVEGPCEPASAGAAVIPPDETQPFSVRFDFGSVCEHGAVDGSAYYK